MGASHLFRRSSRGLAPILGLGVLAILAKPLPATGEESTAAEPSLLTFDAIPSAQAHFGVDPKHARSFAKDHMEEPIVPTPGQMPAPPVADAGAFQGESQPFAGDEPLFGEAPKHRQPSLETKAAARPPLRFPGPDSLGNQPFPYARLDGLIQMGWMWTHPYAGRQVSEWVISSIELMLTLQPHPWVTIQTSGLYEDNGRSPVELDVAQLRIGPPDQGWFLNGGQFYLPFGRYESNMVSDPLTLKLGETRAVAGALAFEQGRVFGSVYAYQGSGGENPSDTIDAWGAELGITGKPGGYPLTLAIGFLSDMGNDDEPEEGFDEPDHPGGLAASAYVEIDPWTLIGEYVAATQSFGQGASLALTDQRPAAWMLEAGYSFGFLGIPAQLVMGFQGTAEALALGLPQARELVTLNLGIYAYTTLQFEFARDRDYGEGAGGTGHSANTFTAQITIDF